MRGNTCKWLIVTLNIKLASGLPVENVVLAAYRNYRYPNLPISASFVALLQPPDYRRVHRWRRAHIRRSHTYRRSRIHSPQRRTPRDRPLRLSPYSCCTQIYRRGQVGARAVVSSKYLYIFGLTNLHMSSCFVYLLLYSVIIKKYEFAGVLVALIYKSQSNEFK